MAKVDSWKTRTYIERVAELDQRQSAIVVCVWPPHSRAIVISMGDVVMIRLFVIYLSYLNIDKLLQINFVKKFAELK
jgi:hypothetical protein